MRTIIAKTFSNASSLHSSKKSHFQWMMLKKGDPSKTKKDQKDNNNNEEEEEEEEDAEILAFSAPTSFDEDLLIATPSYQSAKNNSSSKKKTASSVASDAVSRLRSAVLTVINNRRRSRQGGLGPCVTGTIFGRRRGRVHLSFQVSPKSSPALLVELEMPTSTLVREMASGLVRIALECHRAPPDQVDRRKKSSLVMTSRKLLEEPIWRAYCNGKKCGYATRRECGPADWHLLKTVEPVSVGAGVLPVEKGDSGESGGGDSEGDVMYMRARFERVVGSKDSEAFYMLNPDGNGGPELSIYLLRV